MGQFHLSDYYHNTHTDSPRLPFRPRVKSGHPCWWICLFQGHNTGFADNTTRFRLDYAMYVHHIVYIPMQILPYKQLWHNFFCGFHRKCFSKCRISFKRRCLSKQWICGYRPTNSLVRENSLTPFADEHAVANKTVTRGIRGFPEQANLLRQEYKFIARWDEVLLKAGDCNCLKICGRGIGVPQSRNNGDFGGFALWTLI